MTVSIESSEGLKRKIRIEVPEDKIKTEVEMRLRRVGKTAKLAGFRPGKVPKKVIQQRYGGQIRQEVLSELMQSSYTDALQQEKLAPAGAPEIQPEPGGPGTGLRYTATFEVFPEIELHGLESIAVTRPEVDITDAEIDAMIDNLRQQKATWEEVDRKAKTGDQVVVDFDGTLKGEPIENGKGENVEVTLGAGGMLEDFEKSLTGVSAGEVIDFKVKYPKDYPVEELAGKKADFNARVHRVNEQKIPDLNDELAALYGVQEGGLDKLRDGVADNMRNEANLKVRNDVKEQALSALLAANDLQIPEALIEREIHSMQHEAMRQTGIKDHDQAPAAENFKEGAERRVKLGLLVQEFVTAENITLDEGRVRDRIAEMFAGYEDPEGIISMYMGNPELRQQIEPLVIEEQAIEQLIKKGTEKTKSVGFKEYMDG